MSDGHSQTRRLTRVRSGSAAATLGAPPDRVGRYEVLGELGQGGMGVVYRARDSRLDRHVALKALPSALATSSHARERFEREARLLAALEHPHVASIYGLEEADGRTYLVLQLVEGETLAARLARGPLPVSLVVDVGRQLASGLAAAHRRGIVHCDLKPGNVMIAPDGTVKLLDFGVATRWRRAGRKGLAEPNGSPTELVGTPAYMSPEQARGEPLDPRTDVWAFGCLLVECLTGRKLFDGVDESAVLKAVAESEPDLGVLPADLPPRVRDLIGRCLVKDRERRLADIGEAGRALERGPATPGPAAAGGVPRPLTTFVGRAAELERVASLIGGARLVTLTGAAGCGKTRLAIEAVAREAGRFPGSAWLVPLASVMDAGNVEAATLAALGVRLEKGQTELEAILQVLRPRTALLILDNCEHVLDAASSLAETILRECAGLTILCTSREALGVGGETAWRVPSLEHPPSWSLPPLPELESFDGVRLFVERAREAQPSFVLDEVTAPAVAALVERLDGIPLAIELAAARLRVLTPQQVLDRLADRFRLLTGGSRTALERHQTLRAALDWSYDLLDADEKRCLRELSVFAGGFRLEEAAQVCTGDEFDVLDLVTRLVDKSLVQAEVDARKSPRYRLLESVRQHAAIKLDECGESAPTRSRHRDAYLRMAEEDESGPSGERTAGWLHRMDTEKANMRAALEWSLSDDADAEEGLRLAAALGPYWERGGHWPEGWQWLKRTIARPGVAPGSRNWARAKRQLGSMAWWLGELEEARLHASEAQAAFEALADEAGAAGALMGRGTAAHAMGDLRGARDIYAEVLARGRSGAARMHDVTALTNLSVVCRDLGELEEARRFAEQARSLAERQGARIYLGRALRQLGVLARDAGRHDEAWELISRAATAYDEHLEPRDVVFCRLDMAAVARLRGDTAKARELYMLCEAMLAELGDRRIRAMALANLAILDREAGDLDAARRGLAESLRVTLELGARSLLASIASERAWLLVDECRPMEAARLLGAVEAVRAQTGRRLGGIELEDLQRRMAALRQRLGDEAFDEARRQGASAGLESEIGRLG